MSFPGIPSPGEVIQAALTLKTVYDAFFDKHQNAAKQVRELAQLVTTFSINLLNQGRILERAGKFFPGEENFLETIAECDHFLKDYESLLRTNPNRAKKIWETAKWPLQESPKRLMEKLHIHVAAMNSFSLNLLLDMAVHDRVSAQSSTSIAHRIAVSQDDPTLEEFGKLYDNLYNEVLRLQNFQKRRRSGQDIQPQLVSILDQWRNLLVKTGLPEDKLPNFPSLPAGPLPRVPQATTEDNVEAAVEQLTRALNAQFRIANGPRRGKHNVQISDSNLSETETPTPSSPIGRRSGKPMSPAASFPKPSPSPSLATQSLLDQNPDSLTHTTSIGSAASTTYTQPSPGSNSVFSQPESLYTIPSPSGTVRTTRTNDTALTTASALFDPIATLKLGKHRIPLYSYDVDESERPRLLRWNARTQHPVEHILPSGSCRPFTKHSSISDPLEVSLLEACTIQIGGKVHTDQKPQYIFKDEKECKNFQSTIHRRQLLSTFEVDKIVSATSSKRGDASDQHLKIWKSATSDRHYLCYYANGADEHKHRELQLIWFERPSRTDKAKTPQSVRLTVMKNKQPGIGVRRLSEALSRTSTTRSASITSLALSDTRRPSLPVTEGDFDTGLPEDVLKMGYLEILLSSKENRADFIDAIIHAQDESLTHGGQSPTISQAVENSNLAAPRRATPSSLLGLTIDHRI